MCKFHYSIYAICKCELYNDHPEYCQNWLYPYPHYHPGRRDRPPWVKTLLVRGTDKYGLLDEYDNNIHYTTMPPNPNDRLKRFGCGNSKFEEGKGKMASRGCPYHGSGGLKGGWDRVIADGGSKGVETLERKRGQKRKDHYVAEKQRMEMAVKGEGEGKSCCSVQ